MLIVRDNWFLARIPLALKNYLCEKQQKNASSHAMNASSNLNQRLINFPLWDLESYTFKFPDFEMLRAMRLIVSDVRISRFR